MSEVLKKFGRYFLLDHLAQGGMAEIYRARLASTDGAGRIIVIKRIQGGFGANKEFLQMFKSEIKVTMGFNHPNIVQLYDFGEEEEQPFIAMEWIDGRNLRQLMSRFAELKQSFPIELVTYIIEQSASGLNYAHSFKDKISGTPLNVVHRDISPQNIITSFEGSVKVIDFGIAKATTNVESTRAGIIKGKPSYLSPEQISGDTLDGRSDIFALGTVLWELLTGKKLFVGESDLAVLKQIESCQAHVKPPSTLNPKVPKELDYIVLKTLAKQREKRFQTAEELQRALHKFLFSYAPEFNPSDLSYHARDLFKNEIVEDRKLIQKLNDKAEKLLVLIDEENSTAAPKPTSPKKKPRPETEEEEETDSPTVHASGGRAIEFKVDPNSSLIEFEAAPANAPVPRSNRAHGSATFPSPSAVSKTSTPVRQSTRSHGTSTSSVRQSLPSDNSKGLPKFAVMAFVGLLALAFIGPQFGVNIPILSEFLTDSSGGGEARLMLLGTAKNVTITINGKKMAKALPATLKGLAVGTPLQVLVANPDGSFQEEITLRKGEQKTITVLINAETTTAARTAASVAAAGTPEAGDAKATTSATIQLRLNISPGVTQAKITLNGAQIDSTYPVVQAPLDSPLSLQIESPGYKIYKKEFTLASTQLNGLREWPLEISLEAGHFGTVSIHTIPSADVTMIVNGMAWKRKTPIEDEKLPVGTYLVQLTNEILSMEKSITITVEEGKSVKIDERLGVKNQ